jgi:hypothetical protein
MDQPPKSITGALSGIMRRSKKLQGFPRRQAQRAQAPTGLGIDLRRPSSRARRLAHP